MRKATQYRRLDPPSTNHDPHLENDPRIIPGLTRLAELLLLSRARHEDPCQRALASFDLAPSGLTLDDLRALVTRGLVATLPLPPGEGRGGGGKGGVGHQASGFTKTARGRGEGGRKSPSPSGRGRGEGGQTTFQPRPPTIGPRTQFILTDAGLADLMKHVHAARRESSPASAPSLGPCLPQSLSLSVSPTPSPFGRGQGEGSTVPPSLPPSVSPSLLLPLPHSQILPHYDIDLRELSVAGEVILRLPVQGRNLIAVLTELERSGWKSRVVKPFNGRSEGSDPTQLAAAAYSLNLRQTLIEFHADDGAIRWEWRSLAKFARRDTPGRNGKAAPGRVQMALGRREHR